MKTGPHNGGRCREVVVIRRWSLTQVWLNTTKSKEINNSGKIKEIFEVNPLNQKTKSKYFYISFKSQTLKDTIKHEWMFRPKFCRRLWTRPRNGSEWVSELELFGENRGRGHDEKEKEKIKFWIRKRQSKKFWVQIIFFFSSIIEIKVKAKQYYVCQSSASSSPNSSSKRRQVVFEFKIRKKYDI